MKLLSRNNAIDIVRINPKVTKRMKIYFFLLLLLSTIISPGCRQTKSPNSDSFAESQIEEDFLITNLELLGYIWGVLKYHHPEVGKGKYDWDNELFQFLPEYLNVNDTRQRDETLLRWIEKYGELPICTTCKETDTDAYQKPDFSWVESGNMSAVLKEKIKEIYQNRHQGTHYYIKKAYYDGNPEFLNEQPYSISFPDKNLRLLALYRYWNIIQYFFPYKYLTDKNWIEVLREYIPKFIFAKTALEYQLTVLQLTGEINDTHAKNRHGVNEIDSLRGTMYAPFRVRFIENKLTVTDYHNPELKETAGLEIGDFITHINGKEIEYIIDSIKSYYPASNEAARMTYIAPDLVRSNNHSIHIVYNSSGTMKHKELTLYKRSDLNMNKRSNKLSYDSIMIDKGSMFIGYITLETIKDTEIIHIKKSFINAKGIIIDIRNYPAAFVPFSLGNYFTSKRKPFAKFTTANIDNPGEFNFSHNVSFLDNNAGNPYSSNVFETPIFEKYFQGKLVVIVNEESISQAEYTAMAFRAGDNTVIIGSQTQGADGNVSFIPLPGGLKTGISGIGVYYPDGRGTQRIGIVPDIEVKPT
ncbi:MAG: hypothetical protein LBS16_07890 [Prevotellaceae bacterium]|nr:hypothetical protein [Prevotellaceae bacterium]